MCVLSLFYYYLILYENVDYILNYINIASVCIFNVVIKNQ